MTIQDELALSMIDTVDDIDSNHNVVLVKNKLDNQYYVKKELTTYNKRLYEYIKETKNKYFPIISECIEDSENLDSGEDGKKKLIVIEEYISGKTLTKLIEENGHLTEDESVRIILEVAKGLKHLHDFEFVNRDVKPDNIIITRFNEVKIVDINTAKKINKESNTDTQFLGTPSYFAPEQIGLGYNSSDVRTDIYAVGIVFNRMLTGCFPKDNLTTSKYKDIIVKATKLDPEERYSTMDEFIDAVKRLNKGKDFETVKSSDFKNKLSQIVYNAMQTKQTSFNTKSFLFPGYRSLKLWKMCLATLYYICAVSICFYGFLTPEDIAKYTFVGAVFILLIVLFLFIFPILFLFNYRGIRDVFPGANSANRYLGFIASVFWIVICCTLVVLIGFGLSEILVA